MIYLETTKDLVQFHCTFKCEFVGVLVWEKKWGRKQVHATKYLVQVCC